MYTLYNVIILSIQISEEDGEVSGLVTHSSVRTDSQTVNFQSFAWVT